jgi:zinc transport system ATP-binding protein
VRYSNGVQALTHITFEISGGDFVGLLGPNGAGKSTLIGAMLGLIPPSCGEVALFGEPISPTNLRKVGYVPQATQLSIIDFPATVFETVLLGRIPHLGGFKRFGKKDNERVEEALRLLEIFTLKGRKLNQLSYGQLQRVLVAKALVTDPELLLLDEPTSGADVHSKREFFALLKKINEEEGTAILLSSHDVGAVTRLVKRLMCINNTLFFCDVRSKFTREFLDRAYNYPVTLIEHDSHA